MFLSTPSLRVRLRATAATALLLAAAACQREPSAPTPVPVQGPAAAPRDAVAETALRADLRVLADDRMQGRATGTAGFDAAARYVAGRMRQAGLAPAGDDGGYFQRVPLLRATRLREDARLDVVHPDRSVALRFGDQFLPTPDCGNADGSAEGRGTFVGDDATPAVRGRIAVLFAAASPRLPDDAARLREGPLAVRLRALDAIGAIGAIVVDTPADEAGAPWAQAAANWQRPALCLRDADGRPLQRYTHLRTVVHVAAASAGLVFDGSGRDVVDLFNAARNGALHGFALPLAFRLHARSRIEPVDAHNVVGRWPAASGAREAVLLAAHLDHLGTGAAVDGDGIYNGAIDNALGVAVLLQAARDRPAATPAARRDVMFAATTAGEPLTPEQPSLGAQWLAAHPPAGARWAAALAIDTPLLLAPTSDLVAVGADHSSLVRAVDRAAKAVVVRAYKDPYPEDGAFAHGDQAAFAAAGVPALALQVGTRGTDKARDPRVAQRDYLRQRHLQPSDDATQAIDYPGAARMARFAAILAQAAATDPQAPRWNDGDAFGHATPPAAH